MAAERKMAPDSGSERSQSPALDGPVADAPVGAGSDAASDRLAGLDVRAQSALLQEAFQAPYTVESETSATTPSPQRGSIFSRYGSRAVKSALGLLIVAVAGVGPVQRL